MTNEIQFCRELAEWLRTHAADFPGIPMCRDRAAALESLLSRYERMEGALSTIALNAYTVTNAAEMAALAKSALFPPQETE